MTTVAVHGAPAPRRVAAALTRLAARQIWTGAATVTVLTGGMTALVAGTYRSTFADALNRQALQTLAANPAVRTLFGEPVALDSTGGFTVWRTGTALAVLLGAWAVLAATRITRGEEDAGRWHLLLAGRIPLAAAVARHVAVVAVAPPAAGAAAALALIASGAPVHGAALQVPGSASSEFSPYPSPRSPDSCCPAGARPTRPPVPFFSAGCWPGCSATAPTRSPGCGGSARSG